MAQRFLLTLEVLIGHVQEEHAKHLELIQRVHPALGWYEKQTGRKTSQGDHYFEKNGVCLFWRVPFSGLCFLGNSQGNQSPFFWGLNAFPNGRRWNFVCWEEEPFLGHSVGEFFARVCVCGPLSCNGDSLILIGQARRRRERFRI